MSPHPTGCSRSVSLRHDLLGRLGSAGLAVLAWVVMGVCPASSETPFITLASTTSTQNSGLLAEILPQFEAESGVAVRVVAVGTGAAIRMASKGDADVLLVHDRTSEDVFVSEGYGVERFDVMYNDFVIVGPKSDPAGVVEKAAGRAAEALRLIAGARAVFVSRGDDSGTHKAEMRLWTQAGIDPIDFSGQWYRETGSGMGATLNTANAMDGYALTDRGTWLSFRNRGELRIVVEGDPPLFNPYGVIQVSSKKHPHVKAEAAHAFVAWLVGPKGQAAIGAFRLDGQELFHPNAKTLAE